MLSARHCARFPSSRACFLTPVVRLRTKHTHNYLPWSSQFIHTINTGINTRRHTPIIGPKKSRLMVSVPTAPRGLALANRDDDEQAADVPSSSSKCVAPLNDAPCCNFTQRKSRRRFERGTRIPFRMFFSDWRRQRDLALVGLYLILYISFRLCTHNPYIHTDIVHACTIGKMPSRPGTATSELQMSKILQSIIGKRQVRVVP